MNRSNIPADNYIRPNADSFINRYIPDNYGSGRNHSRFMNMRGLITQRMYMCHTSTSLLYILYHLQQMSGYRLYS